MEHEAASGLVIDWRLLALQAANFLALLGLLTWILWKPMVKMIDERRRAITDGLAAAAAQQAAAAEAEGARRTLLAEAQKESEQMLAETRTQMAAEVTSARAKIDKDRERLQKDAEQFAAAEKAKIEKELRGHVARLVSLATAKLVSGETTQRADWSAKVDQALKELE